VLPFTCPLVVMDLVLWLGSHLYLVAHPMPLGLLLCIIVYYYYYPSDIIIIIITPAHYLIIIENGYCVCIVYAVYVACGIVCV